MDTRTKIVSATEAARIAAQGAVVVAGHFDPLLASHADQLESLKQPGRLLLVAITDPGEPILPARARAELVAGLSVVDRVVESGEGLTAGTSLDEDHSRKLEELIQHVHGRQRQGSVP